MGPLRPSMFTDIDECASGVHDCHSSASCTNTVGSYTCSCNHPYTGDGKKCTHPVAGEYLMLIVFFFFRCIYYAVIITQKVKFPYCSNGVFSYIVYW